MRGKKLITILFAFIFAIVFVFNTISYLITKSSSGGTALNLILIILASLVASATIVLFVAYYNDIFVIIGKNIWQMIKLENLNHPLMVRLSKEAPGTYNHSLLVAELATKAAKAIGYESNYLRLGGYYHDIGKLKTPKIFNENRKDVEKKISSEQIGPMAKAIIDHVPYGVKLAHEFHLPDEIIDYISQHHGSASIDSLQGKLKENNLEIRYPGPKPLSKGAAILMLADNLEARIRTIKNINEQTLNKTVNDEINKKLLSGQLELSGLSSSDIEKLKKSFVKTLQGIHHFRKLSK